MSNRPQNEVGGDDPFAGGTGYLGNYDPNWKAPTSAELNNVSEPYIYKENDWQIILGVKPDVFLGIQNNLMKAFPGWKPDSTRVGDYKTIQKFGEFLKILSYDGSGVSRDWGKALPYFAENPLKIPTANKVPAIRLTSPIDLRPSFERGAQAVIGETFTPEQTKKLEKQFAQMETQYQRGAATGAGGTVVQPPDPTAFAQEQARKLQPTAAKATEYSDYMGILSELLQG